MSQTELGKKVGADQGRVSRWERNIEVPDDAMIERLAAALGVSAVELLTGRPAAPPKRAIRLTADNFADHLRTSYAASLVEGFTAPEGGIDPYAWVVTKLLAWVEHENARRPDVHYEMSRFVAAVVLERLAQSGPVERRRPPPAADASHTSGPVGPTERAIVMSAPPPHKRWHEAQERVLLDEFRKATGAEAESMEAAETWFAGLSLAERDRVGRRLNDPLIVGRHLQTPRIH